MSKLRIRDISAWSVMFLTILIHRRNNCPAQPPLGNGRGLWRSAMSFLCLLTAGIQNALSDLLILLNSPAKTLNKRTSGSYISLCCEHCLPLSRFHSCTVSNTPFTCHVWKLESLSHLFKSKNCYHLSCNLKAFKLVFPGRNCYNSLNND